MGVGGWVAGWLGGWVAGWLGGWAGLVGWVAGKGMIIGFDKTHYHHIRVNILRDAASILLM